MSKGQVEAGRYKKPERLEPVKEGQPQKFWRFPIVNWNAQVYERGY